MRALLCVLLCGIWSVALACEGDRSPVIVIDGKVVFEGRPAADVMDDFALTLLPVKARQANKQGIALDDFFPEKAAAGEISIYSCGRNRKTYQLAALRGQGVGEGRPFLALTKKNTLKLVKTLSPEERGEALLKRVTRIEVKTH